MTKNETDSGPRISSIIQIVLVSNDGEWEWFWAQNHSYYPSGRNPEICGRHPQKSQKSSRPSLRISCYVSLSKAKHVTQNNPSTNPKDQLREDGTKILFQRQKIFQTEHFCPKSCCFCQTSLKLNLIPYNTIVTFWGVSISSSLQDINGGSDSKKLTPLA